MLKPHNVNQALRSLCVYSCRTVTKIIDPEQLRVAATIASKSNELTDLDALRASITDHTKLDAGVKELKDHIAPCQLRPPSSGYYYWTASSMTMALCAIEDDCLFLGSTHTGAACQSCLPLGQSLWQESHL